MGSLDDPVLQDYHLQIQRALSWGSQPDWQTCCEVLNGMSMADMLDELWRLRTASQLNGLSAFAPRATGVNVPRLRAGIGAILPQPPGDFDSLLGNLPLDQQWELMRVCIFTQGPLNLNPANWSKFYWQTRALPAPDSDDVKDAASSAKGGDDDSVHLGLDAQTGATANAPRGISPMTYQATLVLRNANAWKFGDDDTELDVLHEPNFSLQLSPDPNNAAVKSFAFSVMNLHLKRNWGLVKPDVEISFGPQVNLTSPGNVVSGAVQAQVELHLTTQISLYGQSSVGLGPAPKPGDPPDYGALHSGNWSFSPFVIGVIGHWDPPF